MTYIQQLCTLLMILFSGLNVSHATPGSIQPSPSLKPLSLYILQGAAHPALDATRQGILETMAHQGWVEGKNLTVRTDIAQGTLDLAATMVQRAFYGDPKPDFVIGIGTTVSQILSKHVRDPKNIRPIQLAFSSVTDPASAGLIQSLECPGYHTSGVSNFVDLEPQLVMLQTLLNKKNLKLGVIYNPGEVNSVQIIHKLQELCPKLQMTLVTATAPSTDKIAQAAMKLRHNSIDACFLHNDNTALSASGVIFRLLTEDARIPVVAGDNDMVPCGALFALGPNQRQIGAQTALMILDTWTKNQDMGERPVQFPHATELHLNLDTARKTGVTIPEAIRQQAAHVIGTDIP